ncbi:MULTISPECIES: CRISPR-associated endonuclease Cas2 [Campylobacter]|uniref:CRISPR-associated endonuclease Cas2 n=2 Tax=Campylobacter molothri TaxID=1032242 RepID=A0ACC5VZI4_9BACT|nr:MULTISPECIES: CRISPR-associated endonuclease Cas2 [unclassified Campylobacter]MBZ7928156.1 CRISPR-associated endonuclease Cas2 [Campylobacter sp. RM10542]MBZ7930906.1 CRISPR-associated endonuclease Cas2 [Campylobacter sp. RM12910]MBZ7934369.1 CRISPR-associated endonuclease Cas2 [Campylobacter sp. W0065]MBZ7941949.1 CRISPR-associated endonuclease Cas2 [Campylobacter sp. W0045]MBZ7947639.1 CRISPR-associated endonuclease Cas2 [Campylobacter sp. RM9929]MBZ7955005.1 CRISPR-associated endonuclea
MIEDKFMRVLLMFDIPTKSKKDQKHASKFRTSLIKLGFFMMQFSVYVKICKGLSSAKSTIKSIKKFLPPYGNIRVLIITEKQFDNMQILLGGISLNEKMNNDKNLVLFEYDEKSQNFKYNTEKIQKQKRTKTIKQQSLFEF